MMKNIHIYEDKQKKKKKMQKFISQTCNQRLDAISMNRFECAKFENCTPHLMKMIEYKIKRISCLACMFRLIIDTFELNVRHTNIRLLQIYAKRMKKNTHTQMK